MYTLYKLDGTPIDYITASCDKTTGSIETLSFTTYNSSLTEKKSIVYVKDANGAFLFAGVVDTLQELMGSDGKITQSITSLGLLSKLQDTVFFSYGIEGDGISDADMIAKVQEVYNASDDVKIGTITTESSSGYSAVTSESNCYSVLCKADVVPIAIPHIDESKHTIYFDIKIKRIESFTKNNKCVLEIGKNVKQITMNRTGTAVYSRLVPLGEIVDGQRVNLISLTGKAYIEDSDLYAKYGNVQRTQIFTDVWDATELKALAETELSALKPELLANESSLSATVILDNTVQLTNGITLINAPDRLKQFNFADKLITGIHYTLTEPTLVSIDIGTITTGQTGSGISTSTVTSIVQTIAGKIDAEEVKAEYATIKKLQSDEAVIQVVAGDKLDYKTGIIHDLAGDNLDFTSGKIHALEANSVTTDYLKAHYADIDTLNSTYATITNLKATNGRIDNLEATQITTDYLKANYADINLANIAAGAIKTAMIDTGAIGTAQIADGSITDAKIVGLTANKITAGTLDAGMIDVVNLNAANITVGTINGHQIASGAIDFNNLADSLSDTIVNTSEEVKDALKEAGLAVETANNISVGGRNIIINSATLVYEMYGFTQFILTTNGVALTDNGIKLKM